MSWFEAVRDLLTSDLHTGSTPLFSLTAEFFDLFLVRSMLGTEVLTLGVAADGLDGQTSAELEIIKPPEPVCWSEETACRMVYLKDHGGESLVWMVLTQSLICSDPVSERTALPLQTSCHKLNPSFRFSLQQHFTQSL